MLHECITVLNNGMSGCNVPMHTMIVQEAERLHVFWHSKYWCDTCYDIRCLVVIRGTKAMTRGMMYQTSLLICKLGFTVKFNSL